MTKRRAPTDSASLGRGRRARADTKPAAPTLLARRQTHREKNLAAITEVPWLLAVASFPETHAMARSLEELLTPAHQTGGRPRNQPYWALVVLGMSLGIFGSVSNAARNLAVPEVWDMVVKAATPHLRADDIPPQLVGPNRDHWNYFAKRLEGQDADYLQLFAELSAQLLSRTTLPPSDGPRSNRATRLTTLGIDAKVMNSPQAHQRTERVDKKTGEIRAVRQDSGRGLHSEGGKREKTQGCKFAFASTRFPMHGMRIITGLEFVPPSGGGGEAAADVRLAKVAIGLTPQFNTLVIDGVLRARAIDDIQTCTGAAVVNRPHRRAVQNGGVVIKDIACEAKQPPLSDGRGRAFAGCAGHDLWGVAGAVYERIITADGSTHYSQVRRGQEKRQPGRDGKWEFRALHHLNCNETGDTHTWWEALTITEADRAAGFLRTGYLRSVPFEDPDFETIYGWRSDTESFHAQLEQTFYKKRLPAWGASRQTLVMMFTAMAHNAWTLHAWQRELANQNNPPDQAA